jgi:hypothetical protein
LGLRPHPKPVGIQQALAATQAADNSLTHQWSYIMKNDTLAVLGASVDRLAQVKAQIANLKAEELQLKEVLAKSGESVIDGIYHRAAVSECHGKAIVDWRAVAEFYKPSRQLITAHTSHTDPYISVRVSARKTS